MQTSSSSRERSRLRALADLSAIALRVSPVDGLMLAAAQRVAEDLGVPRAGVFEISGAGEPRARLRWGVGWRDDQPRSLSVPAVAIVDGPEALIHGDPSIHRTEPLFAIGMIRGISAPIGLADEPYGALACFTDDLDRSFEPDEIAFVCSVADVLSAAIDRVRIEEELRSSRQRLEMAQQIAHMGSYDWHIASDTNVWSDELYRIYGTEPGSFNPSYERFLSFIHPDDRERIVAVHRRAFQTLEPYEMDERIIRPDGQIRILESNGQVITDEDGNPVRMIGICFDVTEQRAAAEAALRYEQMRHARRHALEINDNVVQGLATIVYALEQQRIDQALRAADETLTSVRGMVSEMLDEATDGLGLEPGTLRRSAPPVTALAPEPAEQATDDGAIRVVVADDAADMRLMLRTALGAEVGFSVVGEAADGASALALVEQLAPDLLLLDLAMPDMDGLEVARELHARGVRTRVAILSGFEESKVAAAAFEHRAALYLQKGTSMKQLVERLRALFRHEEGKPPASISLG